MGDFLRDGSWSPPGPARDHGEGGDIDEIPPGSEVSPSLGYHRHHGPCGEPERCGPERSSPQRETERHRYAWFPFGAGLRARIGRSFESLVVLATVISAYKAFAGLAASRQA